MYVCTGPGKNIRKVDMFWTLKFDELDKIVVIPKGRDTCTMRQIAAKRPCDENHCHCHLN